MSTRAIPVCLETLVRGLRVKLPNVDPKLLREILGALSTMAYRQYEAKKYDEDTIEDILIFEGERRAKRTKRMTPK